MKNEPILTLEQKKEAHQIRTTASGYIGGQEVAEKATDGEVLQLAKRQNKIGTLHNQLLDEKRFYNNAIRAITNR